MLAVEFVATPEVVTVNVPETAPAATVIVPVTVAKVESEAVAIVKPPGGAGLEIWTVPRELFAPPVTAVGVSVRPTKAGATTVSCLVIEPACPPGPTVALMFAVPVVETRDVVTRTDPDFAPALMTMLAGIEAYA